MFLLNEENHSVVDKTEIKPPMEIEMCVLGAAECEYVYVCMYVCACI